MPAAINKAVYVAVSLRADQEILLYSESYQEFCKSSISNVEKVDQNWANYILGVVDQLLKRNLIISGFNLYITGDVPLGLDQEAGALRVARNVRRQLFDQQRRAGHLGPDARHQHARHLRGAEAFA